MGKKEAQARIRINRLLEQAGWRFFPDKNGPDNIICECRTTKKTYSPNALGDDFEKTSQLPLHNAWVEMFCGSAALTLAKLPAPIEVINDLDKEIVNFFAQLRKNEKRLCRLIALTPYAREELHRARIPQSKPSDLERARRFLVSSMMAICQRFGISRFQFPRWPSNGRWWRSWRRSERWWRRTGNWPRASSKNSSPSSRKSGAHPPNEITSSPDCRRVAAVIKPARQRG